MTNSLPASLSDYQSSCQPLWLLVFMPASMTSSLPASHSDYQSSCQPLWLSAFLPASLTIPVVMLAFMTTSLPVSLFDYQSSCQPLWLSVFLPACLCYFTIAGFSVFFRISFFFLVCCSYPRCLSIYLPFPCKPAISFRACFWLPQPLFPVLFRCIDSLPIMERPKFSICSFSHWKYV